MDRSVVIVLTLLRNFLKLIFLRLHLTYEFLSVNIYLDSNLVFLNSSDNSFNNSSNGSFKSHYFVFLIICFILILSVIL